MWCRCRWQPPLQLAAALGVRSFEREDRGGLNQFVEYDCSCFISWLGRWRVGERMPFASKTPEAVRGLANKTLRVFLDVITQAAAPMIAPLPSPRYDTGLLPFGSARFCGEL